MSFIQIIDFKTTRLDELNDLMDRWATETQSVRVATRSIQTVDRDNPDTYCLIVEFQSYEEAMANSGRAETGEFAAEMAALCVGPVTFRNLDVTREFLTLPSDKVAAVQEVG